MAVFVPMSVRTDEAWQVEVPFWLHAQTISSNLGTWGAHDGLLEC